MAATDICIGMSMKSHVRLHAIWRAMVHRCTKRKNAAWPRYGGRGIRVCKEWLSYPQFRSWAISNGYSDMLTLDRKDNDGGYRPDNCRWATRSQQQNNRHDNLRFRVGHTLLTPVGIAQAVGVSAKTIYGRIYRLKLQTGDRFPRRFLKPNLSRGATPMLRLRSAEKPQLKKAA